MLSVVLDPLDAPGQHARLLAGDETMQATYPGFAVLYKWRLHPGSEESFVRAWSRMTERLRSERGSLGSRLHRGADGFWYSYAQWPSAKARDDAFALGSVDPDATLAMRQAIAESFPEIVLESMADFMLADPHAAPSGT